MLIYYHNKSSTGETYHEKDSYHRTYPLSARNGAGRLRQQRPRRFRSDRRPHGSSGGSHGRTRQEVCARLGWEYEAVAVDWASKDAELKAGNINCIWNGFTCTGREEEYTWSDAYIDNSIVAIVRADSGIESLADLAGKTVMVQSASSGLDALTANEELTASFGNYQIANTEGDYVILSEPVSVEQYAVGFYLGNEALRDAVNEQLLAMAEDGTMMSIAEKYVDKGLSLDSLCLCK